MASPRPRPRLALVTHAKPIIGPLYDRMPVVLCPGHCAAWLDPRDEAPARFLALLQPAPALAPMSARVNSARNGDAALMPT
jgi:putative SOS response-associated peptidase YedK